MIILIMLIKVGSPAHCETIPWLVLDSVSGGRDLGSSMDSSLISTS